MALKFVPPKELARYAMFVDYGNGKGRFKPYDDLGSAKNAWHHVSGRYSGKILEFVDGDWYTLYDIPAGTTYKNLPWVKEVEAGGWHNPYKDNRAKPMTREEYAEWRIKVEYERLGITENVS